MKSRYTACATLFALLIPALFSAQTPDTFLITGCAKFWANGHPVNNLSIDVVLDYQGQSDLSFTGPAHLNSPCSEATVAPTPNQPIPGFWIYGQKPDTANDYRNGVSVGDLVCIQRHILGLDPLSSYPLFAADANKSGAVTGFDIVELRKLLLGIYDHLPNSPSWRIWSPNCTVPNPANPFQPNCQAFPADSLDHFENQPATLVALKVGDVNGDYDFDGDYQPGNALGVKHFYLPDLSLKAGETVDVPIYRKAFFVAEGFQFALRFDPSVLQIEDIIPGEGSYSGNWAVFNSEGLLKNVSVYIGIPIPDTLGIVRFSVKANRQLSEVIQLDSVALPPLFYANCGLAGRIAVGIETASGTAGHSTVSPVQPASPNPFSQKTTLTIYLARPATVWLEVTDLAGRLTYSPSYELSQGEHQLEIPAGAVPAGGLAFYRLMIGPEIFAGKIIRL